MGKKKKKDKKNKETSDKKVKKKKGINWGFTGNSKPPIDFYNPNTNNSWFNP